MNSFAISCLITSFITIIFGLFVYFGNRKRRLNLLWLFVSVYITIWIVGLLGTTLSNNQDAALLWQRVLYIGTALIPAGFYHYCVQLIGKEKRYRRQVVEIYSLSIIFSVLVFSRLLIDHVVTRTYFDYWPVQTGILYPLFLVFFIAGMSYSLSIVFREYRRSTGIRAKQLILVFVGTLIGFIGGSTNFILDYNFNVYPFGNFFVSFYAIFMAYAIVRHKFMDIKLVILRTISYSLLVISVASAVIGLTLLLPEALNVSFGTKAVISIATSIFLIVILDPLRRIIGTITDKIFYKGKIDYQQLLREVAEILNYELNPEKINIQLSTVLQKGLKVENVVILLKVDEENSTTFHALPEILQQNPQYQLDIDSSIYKFFIQEKTIAILESLERKIDDTPVEERKELLDSKQEFEKMGIALATPIFVQNRIIAILILGNKLSGESFSKDDVQLIEVLSPQIGSAIQKANLYEQVREFGESLKLKVQEATEELKERNVSLVTLQNITKDITRTLDFKKVVQDIADAVTTELGFVGAILAFIDDDGRTLRAQAITNTPITNKALKMLPMPFTEFTTDLSNPKHRNLVTEAIKSGQIQFGDSLAGVISPLIPGPVVSLIGKIIKVRTAIIVPIVAEQKVIGAIEVGSQRKQEDISEQEIETIKSMADQLGIVARNIKLFSQLRKANRDLEEANRHLQVLDQAKSEFVSIASHQLRTPMTGIMGYLSMLVDGDFGRIEPKHLEIMKTLLDESQRMIRLINLFLNVSKIEAGKFIITRKDAHLEDLIEREVKELGKVADDKKLKLTYAKGKKPLPTLCIDVDKIQDVLLNLVDNAIKYTAKGAVMITAEPKDGGAMVHVKDSGIGIKKEAIGELFNKFVRAQGIAQIHPDGSGLGLFIAKSIVEGHGGRIWVESEGEGKGSTFSFWLPAGATPGTMSLKGSQ